MTETAEAAIIEGLMKPKIREKLAAPPKDELVLVPVDLEKYTHSMRLNFKEVLKEHLDQDKRDILDKN